MTRNQIEYYKVQEQQRSNLANESIAKIRDANTLYLGKANLAETTRHNQAVEDYNVSFLGEQQRHNLAQEAHNAAVLDETSRSNQVKEQTEMRRVIESERHSREVERQNMLSLDLQRSGLEETKRSNLAREIEQNRSNLAREQETATHNRATEQFSRDTLAYQYTALRNQMAMESRRIDLGYAQLGETVRSNLAHESEIFRSNKAREDENRRHNLNFEATTALNYAETKRAHEESERLTKRQQDLNYRNALKEVELGKRHADVEEFNALINARKADAAYAESFAKVAPFIISLMG